MPHGPTNPSIGYVQSLSSLFKRKDWEIKPIIEAIFMSEHFLRRIKYEFDH